MTDEKLASIQRLMNVADVIESAANVVRDARDIEGQRTTALNCLPYMLRRIREFGAGDADAMADTIDLTLRAKAGLYRGLARELLNGSN